MRLLLGDKEFASQKIAAEYFASMRRQRELSDADQALLSALYRASRKSCIPNASFIIRHNPDYPASRQFAIVDPRTGNSYAFGISEALAKGRRVPDPHRRARVDALRAMRRAVTDQVVSFGKKNAHVSMCELCGDTILPHPDDRAVDHITRFVEIADLFFSESGGHLPAVVRSRYGGPELADPAPFAEFHRARADLRVVHRTCNAKRG